MRRVMLLGLLALALPTALLASSVDLRVIYAGPFLTGKFVSGTVSGQNATGGLRGGASPRFVVFGNHYDITLDAVAITTGCQGTDGTCTFRSGIVFVRDPGVSALEFRDTVVDGTITKTGDDLTVTASLVPNPPEHVTLGGGSVKYVVELGPRGSLAGGNVLVRTTPEPGTLGMLGTGLISLAGLARRKLKLWR